VHVGLARNKTTPAKRGGPHDPLLRKHIRTTYRRFVSDMSNRNKHTAALSQKIQELVQNYEVTTVDGTCFAAFVGVVLLLILAMQQRGMHNQTGSTLREDIRVNDVAVARSRGLLRSPRTPTAPSTHSTSTPKRSHVPPKPMPSASKTAAGGTRVPAALTASRETQRPPTKETTAGATSREEIQPPSELASNAAVFALPANPGRDAEEAATVNVTIAGLHTEQSHHTPGDTWKLYRDPCPNDKPNFEQYGISGSWFCYEQAGGGLAGGSDRMCSVCEEGKKLVAWQGTTLGTSRPCCGPAGFHCHDCTPSGLRWTMIKQHPTPCKVLAGKSVLFVGDSFMRHAYVAFVFWLSGDYAAGALKSPHDAVCEGEGQFEEKVCRHQLLHSVRVCGVLVKLKYGAWPTISKGDLQNNDYLVWGGGNHPVDSNYNSRLGVNNARVVQQRKIAPTCRLLPQAKMASKVVWLSTHARLRSVRNDEARVVLRAYHDAMPSVLRKECGVTKTASVFNATVALVDLHAHDAANLTWDGTHWSGVVNAYKAYAVFNAMLGI